MHLRLEKVQLSELSVTIKPDYCQSGQMLLPSVRGYGLGEGWLALCQRTRVKARDSSSTWVSKAVLHKARGTAPLGSCPYSWPLFIAMICAFTRW